MKTKYLLPIAYHESGHAIAAINYGTRFKKVTIVPEEISASLGHVLMTKLNLQSDYNNDDKIRLKAEKYIKICLSGPIAEMKFTGRKNALYSGKDYEQSFAVCCNLHGPMPVVNAFIGYLFADAEALFTFSDTEDLNNNHTPAWEQVCKLAEVLVVKRTLKYEEVLTIVQSN